MNKSEHYIEPFMCNGELVDINTTEGSRRYLELNGMDPDEESRKGMEELRRLGLFTKRGFTKDVMNKGLGLWSISAKLAIDTDRIELFVSHWIEQYQDEGSRSEVKRMLGPQLTKELKSFI